MQLTGIHKQHEPFEAHALFETKKGIIMWIGRVRTSEGVGACMQRHAHTGYPVAYTTLWAAPSVALPYRMCPSLPAPGNAQARGRVRTEHTMQRSGSEWPGANRPNTYCVMEYH